MTSKPTTASEPSARETRSGHLAAAAAVAFCGLLASAQQTESARLPYVWPDVAAVYFLGTLPLGMLAANFLRRRLNRPLALLAGLAGLLLGLLVMFGQVPQLQVPSGWLPRTTLALLATTSSLLVCNSLLLRAGRDQLLVPPASPLMIAVGLAFATVVPSLYLDSRCEYHRQRLADLVGQFRLGPARELAEQLKAISPRLEINGVVVSQVAVDLKAAVAEIELQFAEPLPAQSTPNERLERARQAAILGHIEETENVLAPLVRTDARDPRACNLLGLAYQGSQQWLESRFWYDAAWQILSSENSERVDSDLLQAVMGVAYADRKLGHYRDAESAYQRALELDSSAAMHFLMAQFYEDAQQATKAHQHAALAMKMDPARYQTVGRELINQLETNHFGCLPVFLRRRSADLAP